MPRSVGPRLRSRKLQGLSLTPNGKLDGQGSQQFSASRLLTMRPEPALYLLDRPVRTRFALRLRNETTA